MTSLAISLLAAGRFLEFFMRSDSAEVALGLEVASGRAWHRSPVPAWAPG
jgi:hypothetical protein